VTFEGLEVRASTFASTLRGHIQTMVIGERGRG
jgi:hypothetical protein